MITLLLFLLSIAMPAYGQTIEAGPNSFCGDGAYFDASDLVLDQNDVIVGTVGAIANALNVEENPEAAPVPIPFPGGSVLINNVVFTCTCPSGCKNDPCNIAIVNTLGADYFGGCSGNCMHEDPPPEIPEVEDPEEEDPEDLAEEIATWLNEAEVCNESPCTPSIVEVLP